MRDLLEELRWRGLLHDATPGLAARLATGKPITGYVGFDPTAPSLQVGNLVPVMLLAHLQRAGGTPIVLMGGGTGLIGDPSGKRTERPLLTQEQADDHITKQKAQFGRFFDFGTSGNAARIVNNADWLRPLKLVDFLRDTGKYFTLSYMLQKESVKARLEAGISYTEFSYMLLQAHDFLHLFWSHHCELQMGGSDQWGNITAGTELIRRAAGGEAHGLCAPLITTSSGAKFGKSEGEAIWLDGHLTTALVFYNFWVNADDRDVEGFLGMFTFKTRDEIASLMQRHRADPGARVPHHALAYDVTERVHGRDGAESALEGVRSIHATSGAEELETIIASEMWKPIEYRLDPSLPPKVEDLFVGAELASSKGDARRLLTGKGLYVLTRSGEIVPAAGMPLSNELITRSPAGDYVVLRKGKKASGVRVLKLI